MSLAPGPATAAGHRSVWTRHWASGATHSCTGSYGATYGGALAAFWRDVHAQTPEGAQIVDLATGNGAVPRLLLELRPALACTITGFDVATPSPAWRDALPAARQARVMLVGNTDLVKLPVADGHADLITSHFGIEYAPFPDALAEALRIRAPGGRFAMVLHHAASRICRLAALELAHIAWLTADDGLLSAAEAMIAPMAQAATAAGRARLAHDADANAARLRFNAAQSALTARARDADDGADVLGETQDHVNAVLGTAAQRGQSAARQAWLALKSHLNDSRFRLEALCGCAIDEDRLHAFTAPLGNAGLAMDVGTLQEQGHLLGWTLVARPAA